MAWFGIYIAIAAVVALTVFVASNWLRQEYTAAPDHSGHDLRGRRAAVAGARSWHCRAGADLLGHPNDCCETLVGHGSTSVTPVH